MAQDSRLRRCLVSSSFAYADTLTVAPVPVATSFVDAAGWYGPREPLPTWRGRSSQFRPPSSSVCQAGSLPIRSTRVHTRGFW